MLSFCIIAKDEEELLPQCLESIKDFANEIILCVDDRTTDNTALIGAEYGAKVHHYIWTDSFAEAHNKSIAYATGDWIGIIDADEVLEKADIPLIQEKMDDPKVDFVIINVLNTLENGVSRLISRRFFRKAKGHYEDKVHNQLKVDGRGEPVNARLYHYGYNLPPDKMKAKNERTMALLRKQVEESEDKAFPLQNLVRCLRAAHRWQEVIDRGEEVMSLDIRFTRPYTYQMVLYDMAYAYIRLTDFASARRCCSLILEANEKNLDALFLSGALCIANKQYREGVDFIVRYLSSLRRAKNMPMMDGLIIETWESEGHAWDNLDHAMRHIRHMQNAEKDDKLDILFIHEIPDRRTLNIAKSLIGRGHRVSLVHTRKDHWMLDALFCEVYRLNAFQNLWSIAGYHDIVHSFNKPDVLTVCILNNDVPVIHDTAEMLSQGAEASNPVQFIEGVANHNAEGRIYRNAQDRDYAAGKYSIDIDRTIILDEVTEEAIDRLEEFYYTIIRPEVKALIETKRETIPLNSLEIIETPCNISNIHRNN